MKLSRIPFLLFFLLLSPAILRAQPAGEWLNAGIRFNLPKKFSAKITTSERFLNGGIGLYKFLFEFEAGYKISKHFDVAVAYRTAWRIEDNGGYYFRNKFKADLSADQSFGRFKGTNRLRYERRTKTYINDVFDLIPLQHLRDKISFEYDIRKSRFTHEVYGEFFFPLYAFKTRTIDEIRLGADVAYKISKHHAVKGGVMIQNGIVGIPVQAVWFRMGYTYSLKL
jgi:hypothetical protein